MQAFGMPNKAASALNQAEAAFNFVSTICSINWQNHWFEVLESCSVVECCSLL